MRTLISLAAAVALTLGMLGFAGSADARTRVIVRSAYATSPFNPRVFRPARYAACSKKVLPQRALSPALVFMIDACYLGQPW
jgi:hypothetical protein